MAQDTVTVRSVIARQTTGGASEETLQVQLNGAAAANTIAIPDGTTCFIKTINVGAAAAATFRLQKTTDGVTFYDIGIFNTGATVVTGSYTPLVGWVITGGDDVAIRLRVTTPGGAALVQADVRTYNESA